MSDTTTIPYHEARILASDDAAKADHELVCGLCPLEDKPVLCDVEHDDNLDLLMGMFRDHFIETHQED